MHRIFIHTQPYRTNLSSLYIWFNTLSCQTALWPPNSVGTKTTSEQKECLRAFYALHYGIFLLARERWVLCNFELVIIYSETVPATNFNYSQFFICSLFMSIVRASLLYANDISRCEQNVRTKRERSTGLNQCLNNDL